MKGHFAQRLRPRKRKERLEYGREIPRANVIGIASRESVRFMVE